MDNKPYCVELVCSQSVSLCTVSPTIKKHAGYVTPTSGLVLLQKLIALQG